MPELKKHRQPALSNLEKLPLRRVERRVLAMHRGERLSIDRVAEALNLTTPRAMELYESIISRYRMIQADKARSARYERYMRLKQLLASRRIATREKAIDPTDAAIGPATPGRARPRELDMNNEILAALQPVPLAPTDATATAAIAAGGVTGFTVTSPGYGYIAPPTIALAGGGGAGAQGIGVVSAGQLTGITLTAAGTDYTAAPIVTVTGAASSPLWVETAGGDVQTASYATGAVDLGELPPGTFTVAICANVTVLSVDGGQQYFHRMQHTADPSLGWEDCCLDVPITATGISYCRGRVFYRYVRRLVTMTALPGTGSPSPSITSESWLNSYFG